MKHIIGVATLAAGLLAFGTASAADYRDGGVTLKQVATALQGKGYKAEITKDGEQDIVQSATEGLNYGIYFYNCTKGLCPEIQFATAMETDKNQKLSLDKVNQWNRENRFGRMYLDKSGDPYIEMDVSVEHGLTERALQDYFDIWGRVLSGFKDYVNG